MTLFLLPLLVACNHVSEHAVGGFVVTVNDATGSMTVAHASWGEVAERIRISTGTGQATVTMAGGSFLFEDPVEELSPISGFSRVRSLPGALILKAEDGEGGRLGTLSLSSSGEAALRVDFSPSNPGANRLQFAAACDEDDHFLGLGAHAQDVDHVGEAFGLWVSEPGVGKSFDDHPIDDWFVRGTRHDSSYPVPFLLRPHRPMGLVAETTARVEVDLCATDKETFSMTLWEPGEARFVLLAGETPLDLLEAKSARYGRIDLPPPWVFAPWNDAVRGAARVEEVANTLREAGAPASVIWTEDFKGGEDSAIGYHLSGEWSIDESLYPDASGLAQVLEDDGFQWLAYFSPFVYEEASVWESAVEADILVTDKDGEPYRVPSPVLKETGQVDLSTSRGRDWAQGWMEMALEIGFDGWMADFAEWLPPDAVLASGSDPMLTHNAYPGWWQQTHKELLFGTDTVFFSRSGWLGTEGLAPVVWAGDQRTSFDLDDGFPTVVAMGLGLAASGVPIFAHDIAGYSGHGNGPTDKELWLRWASLGAFSPIMRTHHGAEDMENWQFDSDEETLQIWVRLAADHTALFPYLYGLAAQAAERGHPILRPTGFHFEGEDWGRSDAWMLGPSLLIAPVQEAGVAGRDVVLPQGPGWFDWRSLQSVETGWFDAPLDQVPVFAASNSIVPLLSTIPDTLVQEEISHLATLVDADRERTLMIFGDGGVFEEADGTTYATEGSATTSEQVSVTLTSGNIQVGGLSVHIEGTVERLYQVVVVTP